MSLVLVIDTASSPFSVALGNGTALLFDSAEHAEAGPQKDLSLLVDRGLAAVGRAIDQIGHIAVDIGPGGLSSVRTGVAFANALSFGLGKPLLPYFSFELMGFEAQKIQPLPVLCTANASGDNAYAGLYDRGSLGNLRFGPLETLVREAVSGLAAFQVAGYHRTEILEMFGPSGARDSGVRRGRAGTFFEMRGARTEPMAPVFQPLTPINEQSEIFHAGT